MSDSCKIALAQINPLVGDVGGNTQLVIDNAVQARDQQGAHLVVFPELTLCGYPPEDLLQRHSLINWCHASVKQIAATVKGIDIVLGLPWQDGKKLRNAAVVLRDGEIIAKYYKQKLPNYGVFDEKRYFKKGNEVCVFESRGIKIGLTICEDIWQPEPAAMVAKAGAQIIVNLNASPYHICKQPKRLKTLQQRARETGLPIVYVNSVGGQDELVFDGQSMVVDSSGERVLQAPSFEAGLHTLSFPFTSTAAIEAPQCDQQQVYDALVLGVRDYVQKNGFPGVLLGLSGGIDSALTLTIAVDALGAENVNVVLMPSRYTADMSNEDAVEEAELLGVEHETIPIEPAFKAFQKMLAASFEGMSADVTEENIQARCRGMILMALSNKTGRMLLTTGNKSEMSVGYATLYGDMAGGFAPLKDVSKLLVYSLSRYRNTVSQVIPERVIVRPPSAELAPDQKDSDSLPDYEILDPILERFIEKDQSVEEIVAAGFDKAVVIRIATMVLRNEYKRRQAPPGVRITQRGFGKDRRYPITSGYAKLFSE